MQENLVAGLVSGLIVTFFVLVFRSFWYSVIIPWFEDRVYKDIRIEGKWFGLYPETYDLRQDVIVIKRRGHSVTGNMICTNGADEGEEYSICGSFRNLLLPLTYESTDKSKSDRGSITLKCVRNGERLSGKIALYQTLNDSIVAGNILWFRSKDDLDRTIEKINRNEEEMKDLKKEKERIEKEEAEIESINHDDKTDGEIVVESED